MSNTFGKIFRLTTFGESHGAAIGGIIDGMPSGIRVDMELLTDDLKRRRPGQSAITTSRQETDEVEILSGIYEGVTTGTPIAFMVKNKDARSEDYKRVAETFRPSHADLTYAFKYGVRDPRGGGRSSARETIARVVGGAFAKMILQKIGVEITAYTSSIGNVAVKKHYDELDFGMIEKSMVRCPDPITTEAMIQEIWAAKSEGDTVGGVVTCVIRNCPIGLGEPCYDKLQATLAYAMMSINAAKGFEYGSGFEGTTRRGSRENDPIYYDTEKGKIDFRTNNSGGIQGGISNGATIYFKVGFKPVATIMKEQHTIDNALHDTILKMEGRHDPCVVPRAVPIVEAMAAMVILDAYLQNCTTTGKAITPITSIEQ